MSRANNNKQDESNSRRKSARYESVMNRLKRMAQPVHSRSFRNLALSKTSNGQIPQPPPISTARGKNPDDLAGWMSSITRRAKAALLQDDSFEIETEQQIARSSTTSKLLYHDNDDEEIVESSSFSKLGELLKKRKRSEVDNLKSDKKLKLHQSNDEFDDLFVEEEEEIPVIVNNRNPFAPHSPSSGFPESVPESDYNLKKYETNRDSPQQFGSFLQSTSGFNPFQQEPRISASTFNAPESAISKEESDSDLEIIGEETANLNDQSDSHAQSSGYDEGEVFDNSEPTAQVKDLEHEGRATSYSDIYSEEEDDSDDAFEGIDIPSHSNASQFITENEPLYQESDEEEESEEGSDEDEITPERNPYILDKAEEAYSESPELDEDIYDEESADDSELEEVEQHTEGHSNGIFSDNERAESIFNSVESSRTGVLNHSHQLRTEPQIAPELHNIFANMSSPDQRPAPSDYEHGATSGLSEMGLAALARMAVDKAQGVVESSNDQFQSVFPDYVSFAESKQEDVDFPISPLPTEFPPMLQNDSEQNHTDESDDDIDILNNESPIADKLKGDHSISLTKNDDQSRESTPKSKNFLGVGITGAPIQTLQFGGFKIQNSGSLDASVTFTFGQDGFVHSDISEDDVEGYTKSQSNNDASEIDDQTYKEQPLVDTDIGFGFAQGEAKSDIASHIEAKENKQDELAELHSTTNPGNSAESEVAEFSDNMHEVDQVLQQEPISSSSLSQEYTSHPATASSVGSSWGFGSGLSSISSFERASFQRLPSVGYSFGEHFVGSSRTSPKKGQLDNVTESATDNSLVPPLFSVTESPSQKQADKKTSDQSEPKSLEHTGNEVGEFRDNTPESVLNPSESPSPGPAATRPVEIHSFEEHSPVQENEGKEYESNVEENDDISSIMESGNINHEEDEEYELEKIQHKPTLNEETENTPDTYEQEIPPVSDRWTIPDGEEPITIDSSDEQSDDDEAKISDSEEDEIVDTVNQSATDFFQTHSSDEEDTEMMDEYGSELPQSFTASQGGTLDKYQESPLENEVTTFTPPESLPLISNEFLDPELFSEIQHQTASSSVSLIENIGHLSPAPTATQIYHDIISTHTSELGDNVESALATRFAKENIDNDQDTETTIQDEDVPNANDQTDSSIPVFIDRNPPQNIEISHISQPLGISEILLGDVTQGNNFPSEITTQNTFESAALNGASLSDVIEAAHMAIQEAQESSLAVDSDNLIASQDISTPQFDTKQISDELLLRSVTDSILQTDEQIKPDLEDLDEIIEVAKEVYEPNKSQDQEQEELVSVKVEPVPQSTLLDDKDLTSPDSKPILNLSEAEDSDVDMNDFQDAIQNDSMIFNDTTMEGEDFDAFVDAPEPTPEIEAQLFRKHTFELASTEMEIDDNLPLIDEKTQQPETEISPKVDDSNNQINGIENVHIELRNEIDELVPVFIDQGEEISYPADQPMDAQEESVNSLAGLDEIHREVHVEVFEKNYILSASSSAVLDLAETVDEEVSTNFPGSLLNSPKNGESQRSEDSYNTEIEAETGPNDIITISDEELEDNDIITVDPEPSVAVGEENESENEPESKIVIDDNNQNSSIVIPVVSTPEESTDITVVKDVTSDSAILEQSISEPLPEIHTSTDIRNYPSGDGESSSPQEAETSFSHTLDELHAPNNQHESLEIEVLSKVDQTATEEFQENDNEEVQEQQVEMTEDSEEEKDEQSDKDDDDLPSPHNFGSTRGTESEEQQDEVSFERTTVLQNELANQEDDIELKLEEEVIDENEAEPAGTTFKQPSSSPEVIEILSDSENEAIDYQELDKETENISEDEAVNHQESDKETGNISEDEAVNHQESDKETGNVLEEQENSTNNESLSYHSPEAQEVDEDQHSEVQDDTSYAESHFISENDQQGIRHEDIQMHDYQVDENILTEHHNSSHEYLDEDVHMHETVENDMDTQMQDSGESHTFENVELHSEQRIASSPIDIDEEMPNNDTLKEVEMDQEVEGDPKNSHNQNMVSEDEVIHDYQEESQTEDVDVESHGTPVPTDQDQFQDRESDGEFAQPEENFNEPSNDDGLKSHQLDPVEVLERVATSESVIEIPFTDPETETIDLVSREETPVAAQPDTASDQRHDGNDLDTKDYEHNESDAGPEADTRPATGVETAQESTEEFGFDLLTSSEPFGEAIQSDDESQKERSEVRRSPRKKSARSRTRGRGRARRAPTVTHEDTSRRPAPRKGRGRPKKTTQRLDTHEQIEIAAANAAAAALAAIQGSEAPAVEEGGATKSPPITRRTRARSKKKTDYIDGEGEADDEH